MRARGLLPNPRPSTRYGGELGRMGGIEGAVGRLGEESIGGRLPTPQSSGRDIQRLAAEAGEQFEEVTSRMDALGSAGVPAAPYAEALLRLEDTLREIPYGPAQRAGDQVRRDFIDPLITNAAEVAEGAAPRYREGFGFSLAHRMRKHLDDSSRAWTRAQDPSSLSLAGIADDARGELSAIMDTAARDLSPDLQATWRAANRRWQLVSLMTKNAQEQGSRFGGAIMEAGAATMGNLPLAAAARPIGNAAQRFLPGVQGRGLQGLARALEAAGSQGQAWSQMLQSAEQRGAVAVAAVHAMLMRTRPGYRAVVDRIDSPEGEEETE